MAPLIESKSVAVRRDIRDQELSWLEISLVQLRVVDGLGVCQSRDPGTRACPCSSFSAHKIMMNRIVADCMCYSLVLTWLKKMSCDKTVSDPDRSAWKAPPGSWLRLDFRLYQKHGHVPDFWRSEFETMFEVFKCVIHETRVASRIPCQQLCSFVDQLGFPLYSCSPLLELMFCEEEAANFPGDFVQKLYGIKKISW